MGKNLKTVFADKKFSDYCSGTQATILEDYALRFERDSVPIFSFIS